MGQPRRSLRTADWTRAKPWRLDNGLCWYGFDVNAKDNSYEVADLNDILGQKERIREVE